MPSVVTARLGRTAVVTLNRPEVLNAFTPAMIRELHEVLDDAAADHDVGAILLTGAGRGFCAGMDLGAAALDDGAADVGAAIRGHMETQLNPLVLWLSDSPVPVVVAVNGVAAGGGVGLALAGDIVVAARSARFVQTFTPKLGLVPDTGCTWLLPHLAGRARARGLALLGEPLSAEDAEACGVIWSCVDDDDLLDLAHDIAGRLAAGPSDAIRRTRKLLDRAPTASLADQLAAEAVANGHLVAQPDFAAGVAAFRQGRNREGH